MLLCGDITVEKAMMKHCTTATGTTVELGAQSLVVMWADVTSDIVSVLLSATDSTHTDSLDSTANVIISCDRLIDRLIDCMCLHSRLMSECYAEIIGIWCLSVCLSVCSD